MDLRRALGSSPVPLSFGHNGEYKGRPATSLWFTQNDTVVASFVTREDKEPSLSSRNSGANLPLRLRGLFLDASTGSIEANSSWGSESTRAMIVVAHEGKFITQSGGELTLYGRDLKVLGNLRLPTVEEYDWGAYPSPTGEDILFLTPGLDTKKPHSWLWLKTDTLERLHSWEDGVNGYVAISDDKLAMIACTWLRECLPRVEVEYPAGEWRVIATGSAYFRPQFINRDLLGVWGRGIR